jgi:hypothetical protein
MSNKTELKLASSRNYLTLKEAVQQLNENLYKDDIFEEDRVSLEPNYDSMGHFSHYALIGSNLDFFQIGLRYGAIEERKMIKQTMELVGEKSIVLETSQL